MYPRSAFLLPLALAACTHAGPPKDLGDLDLDGVSVGETTTLAHVGEAIATGESTTVADLYSESLEFTAAPDPTSLLESMQAKNEATRNTGPAFTVLSYNVALLDANVFWVVPFAATPHLKERRPVLPDLILESGYDVLLLQEVWRKKDVKRFEEAADRHGYLAFHGPRGRYNDGLVTLVRADLVAEGTTVETGAEFYAERDGMEFFPGPHIKRGYTWTRVEIEGVGPILFFDTHMQAWPDNYRMRMSEARQLGLAIRDAMAAEPDDAIAFLGGDLNGGSFYRDDVWTMPDGTPLAGWFGNTLSYPLVMHYGQLTDAFLRGQPADRATDDVVWGKQVPNAPERAEEEPFGDSAWCDELPHPVFTATDCTDLYFMQYAGEEYPARMDHLMLHDPSDRVWIEQSAIVFTERVPFGDLEPMEPSDHLGVAVEVRVKPVE